jgi:hypothetical protein
MNDDIFRGLGIEIALTYEEDFLKVKETLTRIGVASRKDKSLYQSCHILHKQGRYSILHFKELFILDGRNSDISEEDIGRRNMITKLLAEWSLLSILFPEQLSYPLIDMKFIKVIPFSQKSEWKLIPKYKIGVRKN